MLDPLLLVDASCDVPEAFFHTPSVALMPVRIALAASAGGGALLDRRVASETRSFYALLDAKGPRMGRSEPLPVDEIAGLLQSQLLAQPYPIVALHGAASRSTQIARTEHAVASLGLQAAADGSSRVHVIDSGNLFAGYAVQAIDLLDQRAKAPGWPSLLRRIRRNGQLTHAYLVPQGLQFIVHHGPARQARSIGLRARLAAALLNVTPIVHVHGGQTRLVAQRVGVARAQELLFAKVRASIRSGVLVSPHVVVNYGGDLSDVELMPGYQRLVSVGRDHGVTVHLALMGMTHAMNVGPRALSVGYIAQQGSSAHVHSMYD